MFMVIKKNMMDLRYHYDKYDGNPTFKNLVKRWNVIIFIYKGWLAIAKLKKHFHFSFPYY